MEEQQIKIIRSAKRKKTISAKEIDGVLFLRIPHTLSKKDENKYIEWAKKQFENRNRKKILLEKNADQYLDKQAKTLNQKYFNGKLFWRKILFSTDQNSRMFGNCDINSRIIRISHRLLNMPKFVLNYVIVHELTHLIIPKHGPEFWSICNRYPKTERARGYLMAIAANDPSTKT